MIKDKQLRIRITEQQLDRLKMTLLIEEKTKSKLFRELLENYLDKKDRIYRKNLRIGFDELNDQIQYDE
jgi:hypothetical protein